MTLKFTTSYLEDSISIFRYYKTLADGAMGQLTEPQLFEVMDSEMNSVAITVKHMAGNMRSRWTDFLTSDGEKQNRNRDTEFENPPATRDEVLKLWEQGWELVFNTLASLTDDDMGRTITIRGEPHSVMQAINRQLAHYAYHAGQIVFLAKHFRAAEWKSLSVPRGKSAQFNQKVAKGESSQR